MTRITIVKDDSFVGIDGEFYKVDCSDLPENFHALQWYGNAGEEEWDGIPKPENTFITNLSKYQKYIDRWNTAKAEHEAEIAAFLAAQANLSSNVTSSNVA